MIGIENQGLSWGHKTVAALAVLGGLVVLGPSALAADMAAAVYKAPAAPVLYSWTGFYVGGNVGGHWGQDSVTTAFTPFYFGAGAAAADALSSTTLHPTGGAVGLQ